MKPEELSPVLQAAKSNSYLHPSDEANVCFVKYLNTANRILYSLQQAGTAGLTTSQLQYRVMLSKSVCNCYLRELAKLNVIDRDDSPQEETIWFYRIDIAG